MEARVNWFESLLKEINVKFFTLPRKVLWKLLLKKTKERPGIAHK